MAKTAATREAQLRAECADRYPALPARMWTSAALLAELVGSCRRVPSRNGRILPETEFKFRGGSRRWLAGLIARTRAGEPTFSW